jgi:hypothetical protein
MKGRTTKMPNGDNGGKLIAEEDIIRWSGSPQPYGVFDEGHKISTLVTLCWAVSWGILLIGGYYAFCVARNLEIKTVVMIVCIAIPLLIAWAPVGDKNNVKKLLYKVTDKKITVTPSEGSREHALPISDIDLIRVEKAGEGTCHVRFGSATFKASAKKLIILAIRGEYKVQKDEKIYTGLVFYNISSSDGDVICDLLKARVSIEGGTR